jgi:hypothetical protein
MSVAKVEANKPSPEAKASTTDDTHTAEGAPTDQAHQNAGDGTLTGSVPAGLSSRELHKVAISDKTDDSGTG